MKVIIAGSSGMVGALILAQCLEDERITEVVSLVRQPMVSSHPKLKQVTVSNFGDYTEQADHFKDLKAGFFCIGVYTGQVSKPLFETITVDFAVAFARQLRNHSPNANLCLLSGAGADRTERSRTAFARFKGMAENRISAMGLPFYSFRPAYIYPVQKRKEPNLMYRISRHLYPLIKLFGKNSSITSTELASAMFHVGLHGADQEVLENKDILYYPLRTIAH